MRNSIVILVLALMVSFVACQENEVTITKEKGITTKEVSKNFGIKKYGIDCEEVIDASIEAMLEIKDDGDMIGVYVDTDNKMQIITGTDSDIKEAFTELFPDYGDLYTVVCSESGFYSFIGCVFDYIMENPSARLRLRKDGDTYIAEID